MCHALDVCVVVEGVESAAQLKRLSQLGCEHAQGYLLCHPMPAEQVSEFLEGRLSSGTIETTTNGPASLAHSDGLHRPRPAQTIAAVRRSRY